MACHETRGEPACRPYRDLLAKDREDRSLEPIDRAGCPQAWERLDEGSQGAVRPHGLVHH